ncbi:hypothetical protein Tco_1428334 [Tanacetum coccineum]
MMEEVSLHCGFIHDKLSGSGSSIRILRTCPDIGTFGDDCGTLGMSQISGYKEHGAYIINVLVSLEAILCLMLASSALKMNHEC